MDVWQALAGVGAFMKGKQMAEDRSREIQQQQEQNDWMKRQRAHQEKQWTLDEERGAREAKRLPMLEEMDKMNLEAAKLGADVKKREFDFEYKLPSKNLGGLTTPPMAGAMTAATGMPAMAGIAPGQLGAMTPNESISVDRPMPYSKQMAEDKRVTQMEKIQGDLEHKQKQLQLQEAGLGLREMQITGNLVGKGVLPGGTSAGGATFQTPPKTGRRVAGSTDKLNPQQKKRVDLLLKIASTDPDPNQREIADRILINEGHLLPTDPDLYQEKTGSNKLQDDYNKAWDAAYKEEEKLYKEKNAIRPGETIPPEDAKKIAAGVDASFQNSKQFGSLTQQQTPSPTKQINPDSQARFEQALMSKVNAMAAADMAPAITPNPTITAPAAPNPNRNLGAMDEVLKSLGRTPTAQEMKTIQQMVDNGYNAQSIIDLLQHQ